MTALAARHYVAPGSLTLLPAPPDSTPGDEVSVYYDPMISKLIVHADSRPAALRKLLYALSRYQIGGIKNNISFLSAIASNPEFQKGEVTTHFIEV